jgi:hypothetical protein
MFMDGVSGVSKLFLSPQKTVSPRVIKLMNNSCRIRNLVQNNALLQFMINGMHSNPFRNQHHNTHEASTLRDCLSEIRLQVQREIYEVGEMLSLFIILSALIESN